MPGSSRSTPPRPTQRDCGWGLRLVLVNDANCSRKGKNSSSGAAVGQGRASSSRSNHAGAAGAWGGVTPGGHQGVPPSPGTPPGLRVTTTPPALPGLAGETLPGSEEEEEEEGNHPPHPESPPSAEPPAHQLIPRAKPEVPLPPRRCRKDAAPGTCRRRGTNPPPPNPALSVEKTSQLGNGPNWRGGGSSSHQHPAAVA